MTTQGALPLAIIHLYHYHKGCGPYDVALPTPHTILIIGLDQKLIHFVSNGESQRFFEIGVKTQLMVMTNDIFKIVWRVHIFSVGQPNCTEGRCA